MMLPQYDEILQSDFEIVRQPSKTFKMDTERKTIGQTADGLEAVKQAVYCILNTPRYEYLIYSWNYGSELHLLTGTQAPLVFARIQEAVSEALMQDDRIISVNDFEFEHHKQAVFVHFTVETVFGLVTIEKEVDI